VGDALRVDSSIFADHIFHIVVRTTDKQMILTDATRVVAFMEDVHAGWNFAVVDDPRNPVRSLRYLVYINRAISLGI